MNKNVLRTSAFFSILLSIFLLVGCTNNELSTKSGDVDNEVDITTEITSETTENNSKETQLIDKAVESLPNDSYFNIDFIDVGQADSILISCDDHYALIDGGNVADSSLIYTFLKNKGITYLDYVINTHPDEDHVGGLAGALNYATAGTVYATVTDWDTKAFTSFKKYVEQQDNSIQIPSIGDTFSIGSATAEVLALNINTSDSNDRSIVLMITYGNNKFLLTGDAGDNVEQYLINNQDIKADLLKIAHHGSQYSTSYLFLRTVDPSICVISVGEDNSYGHPTETVLSKIVDQGSTLYRTDLQGDVSCSSDGSNIACTVEKNADVNTYEASTYSDKDSTTKTSNSNQIVSATETGTYVLNTNTKKFHLPTCSAVNTMSEKNKEITNKSRYEIMDSGYSPCKICNP